MDRRSTLGSVTVLFKRRLIRTPMSRHLSAILLLSIGACGSDEQQPPTDTRSRTAQVTQDPVRSAIDEWLTAWSTSQAASVREICEREPGCDPSKYTPEARPETSFGWDGAQSIEKTADWARGPRFWVQANGRRVLLYLENGRVTSAYFEAPDGVRKNICRGEACHRSS